MKPLAVVGWMCFVAGAMSACGVPTGTVQVFVEPEETISGGLQPGAESENIRDGWTVTYDKFLIGIGNFRAAQSSKSGRALSAPQSYIIDLKGAPAGGFNLASFKDVEATRWDRVGFDIVLATTNALRATGLSEDDFEAMVEGGYALFIQGRMTNPAGQSCKPTAPSDCVVRNSISFTWGLKTATSFDDCASETGEAGFSIPTGGTVQVKPTLHGDHWFFTNMTQGEEITERKAQWVADADLNRDGETTLSELEQVRASDVFTSANGYNLSGAIIPVHTARDYLEAQARTLGDYQGEGECPTRAILP